MYQYVVGGLGNQLFQFSMLHFVLLSSQETKGTIWLDKTPRLDRPFLLEPLVSDCVHIDRVTTPYAGAWGFAARVLRKLSSGKFHCIKIISERREGREFTFTPSLKGIASRQDFWIGYFQHFKFVEAVWHQVGAEISNLLESIEINLKLPEKFCLIHVRRGDFLKYGNSFGVLSQEFFINARSALDPAKELFLIVVTDDPDSAKSICAALGPNLVLGPNELDEWQTIKLMSMASAIVTSNSTFSWWGSRVALDTGCKVAIPEPWFVDLELGVQDAFAHPEFRLIQSVFEN